MREPNGVAFDQIFAHICATMEYRRYPLVDYLPWRIVARWRGHYLFLRERTPKLSLVGAIRVGFLMSWKHWANKQPPRPVVTGARIRDGSVVSPLNPDPSPTLHFGPEST